MSTTNWPITAPPKRWRPNWLSKACSQTARKNWSKPDEKQRNQTSSIDAEASFRYHSSAQGRFSRTMKLLALMLFLVAIAAAAFAFWGLITTSGRTRYDEMAGMIPMAAAVFSLGACAMGAIAVLRNKRNKRRRGFPVESRTQADTVGTKENLAATLRRNPDDGR